MKHQSLLIPIVNYLLFILVCYLYSIYNLFYYNDNNTIDGIFCATELCDNSIATSLLRSTAVEKNKRNT